MTSSKATELNTAVRPIRWRLLGVLVLVLTILVSGFAYLLLSQHKKIIDGISAQKLESCSLELNVALKKQAHVLASQQRLLLLLRDDDLYDALRARDAETLFKKYELVFAQLNEHDCVTHFYFQDSARTNLVRVHNRPKRGDLINRFTTREAERTGTTSWGIELGTLGTFTLRVVCPLFDGNELVGYFEIGKEIEDLLVDISMANGVEMAAVINKCALTRSAWEAGMTMLGRESDWDRYAEKVLIYSSLDPFPSEYAALVSEEGHEHGRSDAEVQVRGAAWRVSVSPLLDASGASVGDLIVMLDVTAEEQAFFRELLWVSTLTALLLVGLIGFLYILLKRTDNGILRQAEYILKLNRGLAEQADIAQNLAAEAQEATLAKSSFLANMSHEIRTPMNAVIGMCDLLMDTEISSEQRDFANTIHSSGEALLVLINDILDFSKIEAGELALERRDFDLTDCLESTMDMIVSRATSKGLELLFEMDGSVPAVVRGDESRLRQILLNLLSNAVKFTDTGEIYVLAESQRMENGGHLLTFSIRDTGIGIAPENQEKIFGEFSQADESTTRQFGGTGLGLTISRRLSELMGGTMWVEGTLGEGTTFYFSIEVETATRSKVVLATQKPFTPKNKHVLVVDDNETNLRILNAQLTRWGLTPVSFMKPEEALASIQNGDVYCLMITDMQMPGMDGLMLVHEVRETRSARELPVIMLTSIGQERPHVSLDIAAVISKPVKPTQLHQQIEDVLHGIPAGQRVKPPTKNLPVEKKTLKILLVEDNPINQKVAMLMMKKLGYAPDLASDGIEALEKVDATAYDVVLIDIQMPRMNGLTATQKIRERYEGKPRPQIVGMTAHAANDEREKGLAAGMDDYLTKPIQMIKLSELLARIPCR